MTQRKTKSFLHNLMGVLFLLVWHLTHQSCHAQHLTLLVSLHLHLQIFKEKENKRACTCCYSSGPFEWGGKTYLGESLNWMGYRSVLSSGSTRVSVSWPLSVFTIWPYQQLKKKVSRSAATVSMKLSVGLINKSLLLVGTCVFIELYSFNWNWDIKLMTMKCMPPKQKKRGERERVEAYWLRSTKSE